MWPFRSKKRKRQETEALASTLAAFAPLLGVESQQEAPDYSGLLLYSAAFGAVGAGVASWWLPGQIVEPALLGGLASLLPAPGAYAINQAHLCFEARAKAADWLDERRHKRLQAKIEAEQAAAQAHAQAQEAARKRIEATERLMILRANEAQALERGAKRAGGATDALRAEHEKRAKLRAMLHATYEGHSEAAPRVWQGGQPFGKAKIKERFGAAGEALYRALVEADVILPNGRQPQWNYALVGHTPDAAQRWIEARGIL